MNSLYSLLEKITTIIRYFLSPKEILVILLLLFISFLSFVFLTLNLTNFLKVDRIAYTGKMSEGVVGFPQITNPYQQINQAEKNLSALIFSSLIKNLHLEQGVVKYELGLAEKIETTADFSEIKIHLSPNSRFSDGTKINTADILHTLQTVGVAKYWEEEVVDENIIKIKFKTPRNTSDILSNFEILSYPIISKNENFSSTFSTELITSGAFKIHKIEKDSADNIVHISLKRYDNGDHKIPYLKYYNFYYYTDEAQVLTDLQTKELNLVSGISGQIISKVKDDTSLKIVSSKLTNNFALFLNQNNNTILRDVEFRQVLSESIDRDQLVNQTLGGYAIAEKNILGENTNSEPVENLIKKITQKKDNGLFFENGVLYTSQKTSSSTKPNTREVVKISITTINNKDLVDTANFVANSWKKLGLEVEIKIIDRSQLQEIVRERDFDTLLFGFSIKSPTDYLAFFHSDERTFPKLNIANYASKNADKLLENLKAEKDFKKQQEILADLSKILANETPVVILYKPLFLQALTGNINVVMPEVVNKEEDKYKMSVHWFTKTEKVLPWFEAIAQIKRLSKEMDLLLK